MNLTECQALLTTSLDSTACCGPEHTPLGLTGHSILRMVRAYACDGARFLATGDPVNALAAFLYAFGWLHCGVASGVLVSTGSIHASCPFAGTFDPVPVSQLEKRDEKAARYARLLGTAIASVSPAPDPATPLYACAQNILFISDLYLHQGMRRASAGQPEEALACFSYGHGWLDAGVQAGLFSIHAHRQIFTVD